MTFAVGDKCFAKVKGFPPWPARINVLPKDVKVPKGKYPIFFYGTYEVCFLPTNAIFPYEKYKKKYSTPRSTFGFNKGIEELENNSTILQYGMDPEALTFLNQFYNFSLPKISNSKSTRSNTLKEEKVKSLESTSSNMLTEDNVKKEELLSTVKLEEDIQKMKDTLKEADLEKIRSPSPNMLTEDKVESQELVSFQASEEDMEELHKSICSNTSIVDKYDENESHDFGLDSEKLLENPESVSRDESDITNVTCPAKSPNEVLIQDSVDGMAHMEKSLHHSPDINNNVNVDRLSTIKMLDRKNHADEYAHDFTNLLLEIRKYSWSRTKSSHLTKNRHKNMVDNRARLFYPWYETARKK